MTRIKIFTERYPILGPAIWILTLEYFITQIIVAAAWKVPPYSWRFNTISDLGNTICSSTAERAVCSPLHALMNASFISLGVLMATGSLLIYQEFRERVSTLVGFSLMAAAGLGTLLVGVFPENTLPFAHTIGASLPFLLGNLSLIILSLSLVKIGPTLRVYTFISGLVALIALALFIEHIYLGLGVGGMERIVAYPQTVWLIVFGLYMSKIHLTKRAKEITKPKDVHRSLL